MIEAMSQGKRTQVSIIIPTYNESQNICEVLRSIGENLPKGYQTETIIVDDNSPDGTQKIVEEYLSSMKKISGFTISLIRREIKQGLGSAILKGILHAKGDTIVVMDSDLSHPPHLIPKMVETLQKGLCDIVVASRYIKGGKIQGWSLKRKIMSKVATTIAKKGLRIKAADPMSGFFAFKRKIIENLKLDAIGYKILLEILVKSNGSKIHEIPYTFTERKAGSSKVDLATIFDYFRSVWKLYRYGNSLRKQEKRTSVRFLSKAGRFFTVGASGLVVNYLASLLFVTTIANAWYIHANILGIIISMTSNFFLNKVWTFEEKDFAIKRTLAQYGKFVSFSSFGALVQLGVVYYLVESFAIDYPLALIAAVSTAAFSNFVLNKRWTFGEKIWS
jgi:dolichol-phosphate mannosyltransferase